MPAPDADAPIGVFDSGLGGLTVVRALREHLPNEKILYLGDTARVPYGTRSAGTVIRYARGCARVLTDRGVKILVVACNTVSAVAIELLRAEIDLPVIGVVEPGARAAVEQAPASTRIGVLGTLGTVASGAYTRAVASISPRHEVVAQAAPLLVSLAEEGWIEGEVPRLAAERYVAPLLAAGAGVIVLGCTHFPLLAPVISKAAGVPIVDGAASTARAVSELIRDRDLARRALGGGVEVLVTDLPQSFQAVATRFLGGELGTVTQVDVGSG